MPELNPYIHNNESERRVRDIGVDVERRRSNSDMPLFQSPDVSTRVSILEVRLMNNTDRVEETYATTNKLVERLDTHILQSTQRDALLQNTIGQITAAVTALSSTVAETNLTLREIANVANTSATQILKWDTIIITLVKVVTVTAVVIGALWSVFTYLDKRMVKVAPTPTPIVHYIS